MGNGIDRARDSSPHPLPRLQRSPRGDGIAPSKVAAVLALVLSIGVMFPAAQSVTAAEVVGSFAISDGSRTAWVVVLSNGDVLAAVIAAGYCVSASPSWSRCCNILEQTGAIAPIVGAVVSSGFDNYWAVNARGDLFRGLAQGQFWTFEVNIFEDAGRPIGEVRTFWGLPSSFNFMTTAGELLSKTPICPTLWLGAVPPMPTGIGQESWGRLKTLYR